MKLFIPLFIINFIFCQDEIIHISKIYPNGTPKEVMIYKRVNDDLKSNNPFEIVEKVIYDSNGNYVRPLLTGAARQAEMWFIGKWENEEESGLVTNKRDGSYIFQRSEQSENEGGQFYISQEKDKILLNYNEGNGWRSVTIIFNNRNQFVVEGRTFNRANY